MRYWIQRWLGIAGSAMGILLTGMAHPALAGDAAVPQSIKELDDRLAVIFGKDHIPGASVVLIEKGEITFAKGYGFADVARNVPATADTPFRAGSISKGITAIAIMTLVEQNKLSLDDRLARLIPEVHLINAWEKTDPLRLVHLLEHTTGWPDIGPKILAKDEKDWLTIDGVQFAAPQFISRWKPGRFTSYNNAGAAVAAYALEKATGMKFEDYARSAVLRPMGMPTADFELTPDLAQRVAKSYTPDGSLTPFQHIVLRPAGSVTASARELAQLAQFYIGRGTVNGRQLLTPQSVARIERGETNLGYGAGFTNGYGLGNAVLFDSGATFRGHDGEIDSFTSVLGYSLHNGSGYVLMANGGEGVDFGKPAAHLIQAYLMRATPFNPPPALAIDTAGLQRVAGYYRNITPPNDLLRPYTQLFNLTRVAVRDSHLAIDGKDFIPTGQHNFRRDDREAATVVFVEEVGDVYKIGAFGAQKKEPLLHFAMVWLTAGLVALSMLIAIAMVVPWSIAGLRGRLATRGGYIVRILPIAGNAALAATFIIPIYILQSSGTTSVGQLAEIGPWSIAIFLCSLIYPLLALIGIFLAFRQKAAGTFARFYVGLTSLAHLCVAGYAATIGWLGLRTWVM